MSLLWLIITLIYIDLLFEEWWMGRDMRVFLFLFYLFIFISFVIPKYNNYINFIIITKHTGTNGLHT